MSVHDLQAPKEDGALLSHPPLARVGGLLAQNERILGAFRGDILNRSFASIRALARSEIVAAAVRYLSEAGQALTPECTRIVLAGHQPELFHPGVWLKNFALHGLANAHHALALNLVVDNDTAKKTVLHVPTDDHIVQVPFDHWQSEVPFEERSVIDDSLFRSLPDRAAPLLAGWPFRPMLDQFWREVCRQGKRTALLGERFAAARRALERQWGCYNLEVPLSAVCESEAFAWFACHVLDDLPRFQGVYNAVVHEYRARYGMRSKNHPVPDLAREGDWVEVPFWAWRAGDRRREHLFARRSAAGIDLRTGAGNLATLRFSASKQEMVAQWQRLRATGVKVRTRALTTTLFSRLFLGDLFIHGLGGGKYDELTDEIMRRFYGLEPPAFFVLTGTLLLPFPRDAIKVDDRRRWHRIERDLWWNPQRHLDGAADARQLAHEKMRWIERSASSPDERRSRFEALRQLTGELRPYVKEESEQARLQFEQVAGRLRTQQVHDRRDFAFCLYPEDTLRPACTRLMSLSEPS